jgi:hypothetical protein
MKTPAYTAGGVNVTVSDMRRHLARVLSKLKGENRVTFKFTMDRRIPNFPKGD